MNQELTNQKKTESHGKKMVRGVAIMSIAGIISKLLGAIFRIPLANWIGAKGMSYYSAAYSIYSFFLFISMAGLPVAISRMISERNAIGDEGNLKRVFKVSLVLMVSLGTVSATILLISANTISHKIANQGAYLSMIALVPVLIFAPLGASLRGYFQGRQNMLPTGLSEIIEQFFRVVVGLFLAYFFLNKSLEKASAGATFGASVGSFAAMILMFTLYIKSKNKAETPVNYKYEKESIKSIFKELIYISVPITIGSSILPIVFMIDAAMIMPRLQATGWSVGESKVLYGLLGGYCYPITEFPQIFTIAVAVSMVPAVAEAIKRNDRMSLESNIGVGMKSLMLVSFPCMVGLFVMAHPVLDLLYPARPSEIDLAAPILQILAVGMIAFSMLRAFSSMLQGAGKQLIPVRNLAIGAATKISITYVLVGVNSINVRGAAIGNIAAYFVTALLNYISVRKYIGVKLDAKEILIKPFAISICMGILTLVVYKLLGFLIEPGSILTLISIAFAAFSYFILVFVTGYISKSDMEFIPYGDKIYKIAKKMHLTR